MDVDDAEVGETPSNDSGEDNSDPTRRDADGEPEGWIEVTLETTSLGVKVQKPTHDQERPEIHLEGKDDRSDNEAARRTEDARRGGLVRRSGQLRFDKVQQ
ncbi:hypothetical protein MRX96_038975 [Rhipicephalus microplus]